MKKIAVSLLSEDQEFQRMQAEDARRAGARLGFDVVVLFAENNAILQIQQLYGFVHAPEPERPAALVVEAVAEAGIGRVAANAARAGIGWILLSGTSAALEELRRDHPELVVSSVLPDEVEIGRIQGRQTRALLPSGGRLLSIEGPPDTAAAGGRRQGFEEEIRGTALEIGRVLHGDWTQESAERALGSWLRLKTSEAFRPDLVVCQNDAMAVGARRAMRAYRPEWAAVPLIGCDGLPAGGQKLVADRELVATVVKPTTAGPAVELAARALGGEPAPPVLILKPTSHPAEREIEPLGGSSP
jgi:ABC-type sugar transport system substrate-binding protein